MKGLQSLIVQIEPFPDYWRDRLEKTVAVERV
jgi:hypothetical protein